MADSLGAGAAIAGLLTALAATWLWVRRGSSPSTSSPPPAPGEELREAVKTPASPKEMYAAFQSAWPEGSRESILVLMAQWGIETGDGASMWNYNVGNVKRMKGYPYMMLKNVPEYINGKKEYFNPPHPQTHFRAFDSLSDGVAEYLAVMRGRFAQAWPFVESGDPEAFSNKLANLVYKKPDGTEYKRSYYTAKEGDYTKALRQRFNAFNKQIG